MDKIQEGKEKEEEKGGDRQDDKSRPRMRTGSRKRNIMSKGRSDRQKTRT